MEDKEHIQLINDLVLKTEEGELTWELSDISNFFHLKSDQGEIIIGRKENQDIEFSIINHRGTKVVDELYQFNSDKSIHLYKISSVLWLLVKDLTRPNRVDIGDIMSLLEEDGDEA